MGILEVRWGAICSVHVPIFVLPYKQKVEIQVGQYARINFCSLSGLFKWRKRAGVWLNLKRMEGWVSSKERLKKQTKKIELVGSSLVCGCLNWMLHADRIQHPGQEIILNIFAAFLQLVLSGGNILPATFLQCHLLNCCAWVLFLQLRTVGVYNHNMWNDSYFWILAAFNWELFGFCINMCEIIVHFWSQPFD